MSGSGAAARRRNMRIEARAAMADAALRAYAASADYTEALGRLADEFPHLGRTSVVVVKDLVREALDNRRIATEEQVGLVRSRILAHLDALLVTWMPLAAGTALDPTNLQQLPPSVKAAELVLKQLTLYAELSGVKAGQVVNATQINVNVQIPADAPGKRDIALARLADEAAKQQVIDGELARAGTSIDQARGTDRTGEDRILSPTREKQ